MDSDLVLVIGIVTFALAIPSLLSAFSESRPPRLGALMALVGGIMIVVAINRKSGGYTFAEIPHVFASVIARLMN